MQERITVHPANSNLPEGTKPVEPRRVALITGGSRGIGAETVLALAERGYDVAFTYRNKATRAHKVLTNLTRRGGHGLVLSCDLTLPEDVRRSFQHLMEWTNHLDVLVLNASGGLERDLVASDPHYPMRMNCEAQVSFVDAALPLLTHGSTIVFVTSHWAHFYQEIPQIPAYKPVAWSKHAGEQALRAREQEFAARGIRLVVVTGDLIEGTVTPQLLERVAPDLIEKRRSRLGRLPTAAEMGQEVAHSATNTALANGATVVVGGGDLIDRRESGSLPAI